MPVVIVLPPCEDCWGERGEQPQSFHVEVLNGGLYSLTCEKGHVTMRQLQHWDFEVLFEIGLLALLDGYYREAVFDFASAMERYAEFFVRFVVFKHGVRDEQLHSTWKLVASQSERQLGAFYFAYLWDRGTEPPHPKVGTVKLRNSVVHGGRIPTRRDAVAYGDDILCLIRTQLTELKTNEGDTLGRFINHEKGLQSHDASRVCGVVFETALATAYAPREIDDFDLDALLDYYPGFLRLKDARRLSGLTLTSFFTPEGA